MDGLTTLQFVDSISASAMVRLDLNNGDTVRCGEFDPGFPTLRRAFAENTMRDGGVEGSSVRSARQMTMRVSIEAASQDDAATTFQSLARELDRRRNYLKYQIDGMTKPVFFVVYRSDIESVEENPGMPAHRFVTVRMLAEPYARGLRETLGPYTVNNDPAAGSNGCYFDVTGVIGDVPAPALMVDSAAFISAFNLSVRQHGTPSDLTFFKQAESCTLGTDTTNPGGGPDADMSGTDANNFARTSFATNATMTPRLTWEIPGASASAAAGHALAGTYRVLAVVRRSNNTAVMKAKLGNEATVTIPQDATRQVIDLGLWSPANSTTQRPGGYASEVGSSAAGVVISAARTSGSGTLDWDFLMLMPADECTLTTRYQSRDPGVNTVIDTFHEEVRQIGNGNDLFDGTASYGQAAPASGGFPSLIPGRTNRFYLLVGDYTTIFVPWKNFTETITVHYWPCYLYIRPPAT